jgi:hypothetical protein
VISDDLTYTFRDSSGTALNLTADPRALSVNVDVSGSIPNLRSGDLQINGVNIGPSVAADDLISPRNNAAGSAIAKAAAINRMAVDQGISQGESQSITFAGTPMPGTIVVAGVSVVLSSADKTPADAAEKIALALQASPQFDGSTGRVVTYAKGSGVGIGNCTRRYRLGQHGQHNSAIHDISAWHGCVCQGQRKRVHWQGHDGFIGHDRRCVYQRLRLCQYFDSTEQPTSYT